MSDRRRSVRLAAAVSSILSAPAVAAGAGLAVLLAATPVAEAQETTSQIAGYVVGGDGQPIAGATVEIVHVPTGTTAREVTTESGQFVATNLRVGGPYRVTAKAQGMQDAVVEDLYAQLAQRSSVTLVVQPIAQLAGVEVTGAAERNLAIGSGAEYGAQDVRELPSISRDIKDVARVNPKVWVDPTNSDAMEVAGVNNRYNSLTVDGVRQSDDFGLNNNGYPTQRSPLSVDAIQEFAVLTAPFSVEYGQFRGSTINIVTKSGTNEFSGSAYYFRGKDRWAGDKSKDQEFDLPFSEETYGGTFGGPIIKDKLFFFLNYEKLDKTAPREFGPADSQAAIKVPGVTQAEYDRIVDIATNVYGFDPLDSLNTLPEQDEKMLAKVDWNINDNHRASLAWQRTEGNEIIVDRAFFNNASLHNLSTPASWYDRSILMESTSLQLFSDWNEWMSTELKLARKEVTTGQDSLGGADFAEMRIFLPTTAATVFVGPDEARHANALTNDLDAIKLKANFFLGDHTVTAGYEREMLDIFNLFVFGSNGRYQFTGIDNAAAIDNFEDRIASLLVYGNAFTNVKTDAAASFGYDVDSFYVQDEWQMTPDFKLSAGVRLDSWSSSDDPLLNQNFTNRYGFSNQSTLDGRDLIQPRIGFNWQWRPETTIYGGWGLFGGGSPNVWISNSYTNNGVVNIVETISPSSPPALAAGLNNVDGFHINQAILDNHALLRGDGEVNAVDPDFEVPSQWRWNFGIKQQLPWDIEMTADVVLSRVKDEVLWRDLRLVQTGVAPDGRPIYTTRADRSPCNPGATPGPDGLCTRPSGQDLLLTNTSRGSGMVLSLDFSKTWRTRAGRFDAYLGYGYQDIKDVNSGTSSTARSNWDSFAVADINNPDLQTSNYEIEHQFKGLFNWRKAFFGDYETSIGLVAERRSGRPYSYTFGAGTSVFGDPRQGSRQRDLFYVPAAAGMPGDVIYEALCTQADVDAGVAGCSSITSFSSANAGAAALRTATDAFIEEQGLEKYRGRIAPRNVTTSPWLTTLDMRFSQELPVWGKARGTLTLDIENLANLINKDWGQLRQVSFIYVSPVLDANRIATSLCPGQGDTSCYVYRPRSGATGPTAPFNTVTALNSIWRIQLGVHFDF